MAGLDQTIVLGARKTLCLGLRKSLRLPKAALAVSSTRSLPRYAVSANFVTVPATPGPATPAHPRLANARVKRTQISSQRRLCTAHNQHGWLLSTSLRGCDRPRASRGHPAHSGQHTAASSYRNCPRSVHRSSTQRSRQTGKRASSSWSPCSDRMSVLVRECLHQSRVLKECETPAHARSS